jgi:uncharacterized spore protein YtfJ
MMKHKKGIPSIRTSTLMLAISMAMVGCGGGSGGNTGSNSGGTDGANDGGTSPQPVTVLKRNICKKGSVKTRQHNALNPYSSIAFSKVRPIS